MRRQLRSPTTVGNALILTWSGDLPAGATASITYSVTVNNPDTGDMKLTNTVISTNPSNCKSGSADPACTTSVPVQVQSLKVAKTSTVTSAKPGDKVPYTITVTNTGNVDYTAANPASFSDDLSQVLDDATYDNDATSGGVGVVTYTAPTISWTGPLAAGAVATITYSVTVNNPDTGNGKLDNTVVTVPGEGGNCARRFHRPRMHGASPGDADHADLAAADRTSPPPTTPSSSTPTSPSSSVPSSSHPPSHTPTTSAALPTQVTKRLAWTGNSTLPELLSAAMLVAVGLFLLMSGRTRRNH